MSIWLVGDLFVKEEIIVYSIAEQAFHLPEEKH